MNTVERNETNRESEGNMTDIKMLSEVISESGMTKSFIAQKMGCSRPRLYTILNGGECTVSEMLSLSNILRLTNKQKNDIFLRSELD
jgi:predicted transcriptional regulator